MGRSTLMVFFRGVDNSNDPLGSGMDVKVPDLHGLLMATAVSVEGLH